MARVKLRRTYDADLAFLESLGELTTCDDVLVHARDHLVARGVERMSYHFVSPFHSQTGEPAVIYAHGFPDAWMRLYLDPAFRAADPAPAIIMAQTAPMTWRDAFAQAADRPEVARFVAAAREHGVMDGIGVPLFGPGGRDAYSTFDLVRPLTAEDRRLLRHFREIAQAAHLRISHLVLEQVNEGSQLSMRETEVLSWLVAGKSRADIAAILELSPATVDTYQRRIFAKLDVNDRLHAALRGLSRGLVQL
jgi:LuxR family transcriptional regulator/LuxR family quorum-sensing system transcriptional regulator CciR